MSNSSLKLRGLKVGFNESHKTGQYPVNIISLPAQQMTVHVMCSVLMITKLIISKKR